MKHSRVAGLAIAIAGLTTIGFTPATAVTGAANDTGAIHRAFDVSQKAQKRLTCGQAYLDFQDWAHNSAYIIQSCSGTGTVQYDLHCVGKNVTISHGFRGIGASVRLPVNCLSPIRDLDWTIK